ncbi:MAG: glycoside hydrolase family 43 protein [Ruminococcaceae bacterium]|nr:glycoside hydrolase family 43 protein [Oscillospiraceae bacterium]
MRYKNPILPGFHPDPSICRVGDDFYLVTSTFEFFPGVPIYHSKNLINWELIGHCLTRDSQLPLQGAAVSKGIYAPTLRYHDGVFFMTTTNVSAKGNFIVHTRDIRGTWSEPAWVSQGGIDPSLFWDDDGKCYFLSTALDTDGRNSIFMSEIDPLTGELLSSAERISRGCGGRFAEAPHLYKRGDWYYLMLAEGGTEYGHMETIQRARRICGPYDPCPRNPILSHRDHPSRLQATGHADLVEDQNGRWWLVCLAIRTIPSAKLHHLGRETFLSPLFWNADEWPTVGEHGQIAFEMEGELPGPPPDPVSLDFEDRFDGETLDLRWNFVRNPNKASYRLEDGRMTLVGDGDDLSTPLGRPTMIAMRQQAFCMEVLASMEGAPVEGQSAGLTAFYNSDYHYDIFVTREGEQCFVCLRKRVADIDIVVARHPIDCKNSIRLKIESTEEWYTFYYESDGAFVELGRGKTALLCSEATHPTTFTGTYWGVFCERGEIGLSRFSVRGSK